MKPLWTKDYILAFAANFLMAFAFYLLMPTLPMYLTSKLHISIGLAGSIMSAYVIAALAMRPFSGFLIDYFPRKKLYLISFSGFVILSACYLFTVQAQNFLIARLIHGLIWGVITTAGNTIAIDICPSERRGEGISYYGMSMNIAMALGPLIGIILSESQPFEYVFYLAVFSSLLGLALACGIHVPKKNKILHAPLSLDRFLLIKGIPSGIALISITLSYGLILTYIAIYGKSLNIPNTGFFFVSMALGLILSRLVTGKLLDKGKSVQVAIAGSILTGISLFAISLHPSFYIFFGSAFVLGIGYGLNFPAIQNIIVNYSDHHQRGTANSTYFTAFDLGVGVGILLGGQIAQNAQLSTAFVVAAWMAIACGILLLRIWTQSPTYKDNRSKS